MAREMSKEKLIETLPTKNDNVTFSLVELTGDYLIYETSFDDRLDFVMTIPNEELAKTMLRFMIESYNDGFIDGKNATLMFQQF